MVVDVGLPLDAGGEDHDVLPAVAGLQTGDKSLIGLLISHGHPDHYGLASSVHPSVPVYVGEATQRILHEARFFSPAGLSLDAKAFLRDRQTLDLGPFRVTPFLVDHSAFDV